MSFLALLGSILSICAFGHNVSHVLKDRVLPARQFRNRPDGHSGAYLIRGLLPGSRVPTRRNEHLSNDFHLHVYSMEGTADCTQETSFFVRDTAYSAASVASIAHQISTASSSPDANLQEILALAQSREVDFLPLIHQPTLGNVGAGLTAVVNQRFIRNDLELAFKEVNSGSAFLRELSFVSARALRAHPFITKLQGIGWSVDSRKEGNKWVIKPVLVFEKATHSTLWSFMHTREGGSLSYKQRISICIQLAIAVADLEDHREHNRFNR